MGSWSPWALADFKEHGCPCNQSRYNSLGRAAKAGICTQCAFGPPVSMGNHPQDVLLRRDIARFHEVRDWAHNKAADEGRTATHLVDAEIKERHPLHFAAILRLGSRAVSGGMVRAEREARDQQSRLAFYNKGPEARFFERLGRVDRKASLARLLTRKLRSEAHVNQSNLIRYAKMRELVTDELAHIAKANRTPIENIADGALGPVLGEQVNDLMASVRMYDELHDIATDKEMRRTNEVRQMETVPTKLKAEEAEIYGGATLDEADIDEMKARRAAETSLQIDRERRRAAAVAAAAQPRAAKRERPVMQAYLERKRRREY